ELEKLIGANRRQLKESVPSQGASRQDASSAGAPLGPPEGIPAAERDLIHAMLDGGSGVIKIIFEQIGIDSFSHPQARALAASLLHSMEEGEEIDASRLVDEIKEPAQRRLLAEVLFSRYQLSKGWEEAKIQVEQADPVRIAGGALTALRKRSLERQLEE